MKTRRAVPGILIATGAAAILAAIGFLVGRGTASANESLISLVEDLAHSLGGSTVIAAALLAAASILAAVLVPLVVTVAALHADRKEEPPISHPPCRTIHLEGLPSTQGRLDSHAGGHRHLPCPQRQRSRGGPVDRRRRRRGLAGPRQQVGGRRRRRRRRGRRAKNPARNPARFI